MVRHDTAGRQTISAGSLRRVERNEIVNVSPGEAIELLCTVEGKQGSKAYSNLEWMDGRIPIKINHFDTNDTMNDKRKTATRGVCRATLVIHNFTIYDYGDYRCRCVNDYTSDTFPLHDQLYNPRSPSQIGPICSEEFLVRLLPRGNQ